MANQITGSAMTTLDLARTMAEDVQDYLHTLEDGEENTLLTVAMKHSMILMDYLTQTEQKLRELASRTYMEVKAI